MFEESLNESYKELEVLNEELGLIVLGSLVALGGAWTMLRDVTRQMRTNEVARRFFETYKVDELEKKLVRQAKKIKLVHNLDDLDNIEKQNKQIISEVEALERKIDNFVKEVWRTEPTWFDKAIATSPNHMRKTISDALRVVTTSLRQSFEIEVDKAESRLLS